MQQRVVRMCMTYASVCRVAFLEHFYNKVNNGSYRGNVPLVGIRILYREESPTTQIESLELNQAWGDGKRPQFGDFYIHHLCRYCTSAKIEIRTCIGILKSKIKVRRQLLCFIRSLAVGNHYSAHIVIDVYVFAKRWKEVEQPSAFLLVQVPSILLIFSSSINAIFFCVVFNLGNIVRVLCRKRCVAIRTKGVDATERVLEEDPLFLLAPDVGSIVALNIRQTLTFGILYPNIVIFGKESEELRHNGILYRYCLRFVFLQVRDCFLVAFHESYNTLRVIIANTLNEAFCQRIVSKKLGSIVGNRLHGGLPREEVSFQEVLCRISQSVHSCTNSRKGKCLYLFPFISYCSLKVACNMVLQVCALNILQFEVEQWCYNIFKVNFYPVVRIWSISVLHYRCIVISVA